MLSVKLLMINQFSGTKLDKGYPVKTRKLSLRTVPRAMWAESGTLFAISDGAIYRSIKIGERLLFIFHNSLRDKVGNVLSIYACFASFL